MNRTRDEWLSRLVASAGLALRCDGRWMSNESSCEISYGEDAAVNRCLNVPPERFFTGAISTLLSLGLTASGEGKRSSVKNVATQSFAMARMSPMRELHGRANVLSLSRSRPSYASQTAT